MTRCHCTVCPTVTTEQPPRCCGKPMVEESDPEVARLRSELQTCRMRLGEYVESRSLMLCSPTVRANWWLDWNTHTAELCGDIPTPLTNPPTPDTEVAQLEAVWAAYDAAKAKPTDPPPPEPEIPMRPSAEDTMGHVAACPDHCRIEAAVKALDRRLVELETRRTPTE